MKRSLMMCLAALMMGMLLLCTAASAEDRVLVPDAEWVPPDLSEVTADQPELLLLKVAQEELGYIEEPRGKKFYSKYGDWMGTPYSEWCAEFITWCVNQVDERYGTSLLRNLYPYYDAPMKGAPFFIQRGRFISSNGMLADKSHSKQWWPETGEYLKNNEYIPYPGDYMWLYLAGVNSNKTNHVALVEGVSIDEKQIVTIHVIEGNMPDRVQRATYKINNVQIYGFGAPVQRMGTECKLYDEKRDVIVAAKEQLKALGYFKSTDTSATFTPALKKAVLRYQSARKLKGTGRLDRATQMAMEQERAAQAPEATPQAEPALP